MSDNSNETIAGIVREMRDYGAQPPPRMAWLDLAYRIEAAHGREVAEAEARGLDAGAICEAKRATDPNIELVEKELAAAKAKHPKFCDRMDVAFPRDIDAVEHYASMAAWWRRSNDCDAREGKATAQLILKEELFEALEAYADGRMADARVEFAQVAAVAIRAMEMCEREAAK